MATVLIVDDDPVLRAMAYEMLRAGRHALIEAADGEQALAVFDTMPVDLIVLDLLMPNVDGLELIRALRARNSEVRILAISSGGLLDPSGLLKIATTLGADAVLQKPLRLGTFADAVADLLGRQAGPASIQRSA